MREKDLKILSPYTKTSQDKRRILIISIAMIFLCIVTLVAYVLIRNQNKNDFVSDEVSFRIGE